MSEEKLRIIRNSAEGYKKLSKEKQMFILGFMQGVLINQRDIDGVASSKEKELAKT